MRLSEARVLFIDRWAAIGRSEHTVRCYNGILGRLVRDIGDVLMSSLTRSQVEGWLYGLTREHRSDQWGHDVIPGVSASTWNQNLYTLRAFFKFAQGEGWLRIDPVANVQARKVQKTIKRRPPVETLLRMLETPEDPRDRGYLALALNTALRSSEICPIRVGDLDLAEGYVEVTIRKTKDADEVPISSDLDRELRRWLVAYQENLGRPVEPDDYLFPAIEPPRIETRARNARGQYAPVLASRKYSSKRMIGRTEKIIQRALEAVGLPTKGEGTHTIRRAVARAYMDAVADDRSGDAALRETSALLHHSSVLTTERYLGMTTEVNRRNRRLKGKPFLTAIADRSNVISLADRAS